MGIETFKAKHGKELDTVAYTVKRLNTWSTKTLENYIRQNDQVPGELENANPAMEYRTRLISQAALITLHKAASC